MGPMHCIKWWELNGALFISKKHLGALKKSFGNAFIFYFSMGLKKRHFAMRYPVEYRQCTSK